MVFCVIFKRQRTQTPGPLLLVPMLFCIFGASTLKNRLSTDNQAVCGATSHQMLSMLRTNPVKENIFCSKWVRNKYEGKFGSG